MKQARGRHYPIKQRRRLPPDQDYFRAVQLRLQRNLNIKIDPEKKS